jgi:hypothetical protein
MAIVCVLPTRKMRELASQNIALIFTGQAQWSSFLQSAKKLAIKNGATDKVFDTNPLQIIINYNNITIIQEFA